MIDAQQVVEIHDLILGQEPGPAGGHGIGPLEGALARVASRMLYGQLSDVFDVAAMYAVALARETSLTMQTREPRWLQR
jgi:death-on-curing protein